MTPTQEIKFLGSSNGPGQGKTTGTKSDTSGSHMDISTMVPPASESTAEASGCNM